VTGVDISHYVMLNFAQLEEIVDAIGGVKVYVDIPMSYQDAITGEMVEVPQGEQTLNGKEAQIFARIRKDYEEGDAKRQSNVRQLGEAIIDTVMDKPAVEIPGSILAMAPYISTDLRSGDFISLAMAFGGGSGGVTMYNGSGPTEGGLINEYGGYWYCYPNPEGWARLMEVVDSGGDPSTVTF